MSAWRGMDIWFVFISRWSNPVKDLKAELCSKCKLSRTVDGFITTLPRWEQLYKGQAQAIRNIPMNAGRRNNKTSESLRHIKRLLKNKAILETYLKKLFFTYIG